MKEAIESRTIADIQGRKNSTRAMNTVHASGTLNVPEPAQEEAAATAGASDRIKLFLILFYDLCRCICALGLGVCRALVQRLGETLNNRT